jgi:hypothetical protein
METLVKFTMHIFIVPFISKSRIAWEKGLCSIIKILVLKGEFRVHSILAVPFSL